MKMESVCRSVDNKCNLSRYLGRKHCILKKLNSYSKFIIHKNWISEF